MVNLACALKAKGHDVEFLVYFPRQNFFRYLLEEEGIPIHEVEKGFGFSWAVALRIGGLIHSRKYSAVISFLGPPNFYCELAKLITLSKTPLIVSERSSAVADSANLWSKFSRLMHLIANSVVANSNSHAQWLRKYRWLQRKTHVIYNGYALSPLVQLPRGNDESHGFYLVIGRVHSGKNGVCLIKGLVLYAQKHGRSPRVVWAGRQESDPESKNVRKLMDDLLAQHPEVAAHWHWLGERNDIADLLRQCDALLHVSLYEGLPNAVCEAFIEGRPVIASNVCDHPVLVEDGVRGVLCDPLSPQSILEAIERFEALGEQKREAMGADARRYAEENLTIDKMVEAYEALIKAHAPCSIF